MAILKRSLARYGHHGWALALLLCSVACLAAPPFPQFNGWVANANFINATTALTGPFDYTNFVSWTSNAIFNTPSTPLAFSPLDLTDKKQQMIYLDWGDSTSEYPESPVQVIGKKLLARYGLGGFITPMFGGNTMYTAVDDVFSIVWLATNGSVVSVNGENTLGPYWGPQHALMTAPSSMSWTNYRYLPPGATTAVLNPIGQWFGVTKAAVWYECSPTNSLGQFQVLMSTNNGAFGVAASVNCALGSSSLTTTNVVIQLSTTPTTNYYQMIITNTVGSVRIPLGGMWNEYAGFTHYKMSLGGWDPAKYWRPDVELNNAPGWIQPAVPSWMTNTHDNLFKDSIPDIAMMSNAHMAGDTNGGLGPNSFGTYSNQAAQFVDLSATLNKWNPNMASIWLTLYPTPLSTQGGIYEPWAMYTTIFTNNTGHDYPYFVGRNMSGERWNNTFNTNFIFGYPHWSLTGGQYVANEIWKEMWSWSSAPRTTIGNFNGQKVNGQTMGTYGIDITNGGGIFGISYNGGYAISFGGDAGSNSRTAGAFKTGFIGYPSVGSTVPDLNLLGYSTFIGGGGNPQTEIDIGGTGPNGSSGSTTNLIVMRSRGNNFWLWGGGGINLPDGSLDNTGGTMFNAPANIILTQKGTVFANLFSGSGTTNGGASGLTNMWLAYSNDLHFITPELYGASGNWTNLIDDTAAVVKCEGEAEKLIAQGKSFRSYYAGSYNMMTGSFPITNKCNIMGNSYDWSGEGINNAVPTFVFPSNQQYGITMTCSNTTQSGHSINGIFITTSNHLKDGTFAKAGSVGLFIRATNTAYQSGKILNVGITGYDNAIITTNINDFTFDTIYTGTCTNPFVTGAANLNGLSWNQQLTITKLTGNPSGQVFVADGTAAPSTAQIVADGWDMGTSTAGKNLVTVRSNISMTIRRSNIEGGSLTPPNYIFYVDAAQLRLDGGVMNIGNGTHQTILVTNTGGKFSLINFPFMSGDANGVIATFTTGCDPNLSATEDPIAATTTALKCTNTITGGIFNFYAGWKAFNGLTVKPGDSTVAWDKVTINGQDLDRTSQHQVNGFNTAMYFTSISDDWYFSANLSPNANVKEMELSGGQLTLAGQPDGAHGKNGPGFGMTSNSPANFSPVLQQGFIVYSNGQWYGICNSNGTTRTRQFQLQ